MSEIALTTASRIRNLLTAHGPLDDNLIAAKLNEPVSAIRQSMGRCSHMFSRRPDGKVALAGED